MRRPQLRWKVFQGSVWISASWGFSHHTNSLLAIVVMGGMSAWYATGLALGAIAAVVRLRESLLVFRRRSGRAR